MSARREINLFSFSEEHVKEPILLKFPGVKKNSSAAYAESDRPFFPRIDALRGLGAVAVAIYHLSGCGIHDHSFLPLEANSWEDVGPLEYGLGKAIVKSIPAHASLMFFFVVSGFVLRLALKYGPSETVPSFGRFAISRLFRFFPIVFAGTLVLAILSRIQLAPEHITSSFSLRDFLFHAFLFDVTGVSVLWALQLELLMVPIFFLLWKIEQNWGSVVLFVIAVVASALSFKPSWAIWRPLSQNLFAFILGTTVPTLGLSIVQRLSIQNARISCFLTITILLGTSPIFGVFNRFSSLFEGYAAWMLVSFVAYRRDLVALRWLDHSWLVNFGKWSGSYYVLHMLSVPVWVWLLENLIPQSWSTNSPLFVGLMSLIVWGVLMIGVAAIGYAIIEEPGIRWGSNIIRILGWNRKRPQEQTVLIPLPIPIRKAA